MAKKPRLKAAASTWAAQSDAEVAATIRDIGNTSREIVRLETAMNDEIAIVTQRYQEQISPLKACLPPLQAGVQVWCEANRDRLTDGGKVKFHNFVTGSVLWRVRPPSCKIRLVDQVLASLKKLGKHKFIRTKEEINKEEILKDPDAVKDIEGITVVTDVEDFAIEPFEQTVSLH